MKNILAVIFVFCLHSTTSAQEKEDVSCSKPLKNKERVCVSIADDTQVPIPSRKCRKGVSCGGNNEAEVDSATANADSAESRVKAHKKAEKARAEDREQADRDAAHK